MLRGIVAFLLLIGSLPAGAASPLALLGAGVTPPAAASYTGPGDIVSGAGGAWSCVRGYNAAWATGSNNGCNLRRASDNSTQNLKILANGDFDTASANSFAGTDAICTGTISSTTTLTISSCASGTLHVNDTISGAGITQPSFITAIGTCASPPGTCTLNAAQTVSVGETITAQVALFDTKSYDQSGNSRDASQATAGSQPQWLPSCQNGKPCLYWPGATKHLDTSSIAWGNQPMSVAYAGNVMEGSYSCASLCTMVGFGSTIVYFQFYAVNTMGMYAGSNAGGAVTEGSWRSLQWVMNGASSFIVSDGAAGSNVNPGSTNPGTGSLAMGTGYGGAQYNSGYEGETIVYTSKAFVSGEYTPLCNNQRLYYGSGGSC